MFSGMAAPPIRDAGSARLFSAPVIAGRGRAIGAAALSRSGSKPLQALHSFRQRPERAIEADILVDAVDGAGLGATNAAV